jgi:hypothetical protein
MCGKKSIKTIILYQQHPLLYQHQNVLFIYIPEIWNNDLVAYQSILADADIYYETAPFKGRSNQQDPKRGFFKSVGHGYIAHGEEVQGVMWYHMIVKSCLKAQNFLSGAEQILLQRQCGRH